ncbi:hypothetical protein CYMTET_18258 [Cymbomonas tetramitiformis]|uniref:PH domain-containing protein n=1 Tax=Cymbomonas tetramitiformis TaxID=36881 RepID=A0AAE0G8H7_9CHLO|nr:hypothetical protein CYMTET_18258 [Cymbomonas tetramitiformis]
MGAESEAERTKWVVALRHTIKEHSRAAVADIEHTESPDAAVKNAECGKSQEEPALYAKEMTASWEEITSAFANF